MILISSLMLVNMNDDDYHYFSFPLPGTVRGCSLIELDRLRVLEVFLPVV